MTAGAAISQILNRVRDPEGVTATRDFVRKRLSDSQRLINAQFGFVLDTTTLTTEPLRIFYPLVGLLPEATKVRFVKQGSRNLVYVPWKTMWALDRGWPRQVSNSGYQLWTQIGRDTLVVWPAARVSTALTVESARTIPDLAGEHSDFEFHDDLVPMVIDLATVLVYLKERDLGPIAEVMNTLKGRMKERSLEVAA